MSEEISEAVRKLRKVDGRKRPRAIQRKGKWVGRKRPTNSMMEDTIDEVSKDTLVSYMSKTAGDPDRTAKREKSRELASNKYWNNKKARVGSPGKNHVLEDAQ